MAKRLTPYNPQKCPSLRVLVATWLGAAASIGIIIFIEKYLPTTWMLTIGSFGATAVLLFAIPRSPYAQPRNVFGGHLIAAIIGVATYSLLSQDVLMAAPIAVATTIVIMQMTGTVHPPGGATALIAVIGPTVIHDLGWAYLATVMLGILIMFIVAVVTHNLINKGSYPVYWIRIND